uniref:CSD domain-containing protein n=1 Tax=Ditylenchus dipsaci TaxID=166011 RepID=A0A915DFH3_9BILA
MSPDVEVKKEIEVDLAKAVDQISSLKVADEAKSDDQKPKQLKKSEVRDGRQQKENNKKKAEKKPADAKPADNKEAPKAEDKKLATKPVSKLAENKLASSTVDQDKLKTADDSKAVEKDAPSNALPEKRGPLIVRGVSGKVSWYSLGKGFGFIERDDGEPDVFVHSSAIVRLSRNARILSGGEKVEFDVINGAKGPEAAVVTGVGGRLVRGYTYMLGGQLRINRGPRSRSFRRHRQFKGRRGQTSGEEEGSDSTSSDDTSSDGDNSNTSESGSSSHGIGEEGDKAKQPKGSEVKSPDQQKQDAKPKAEAPASKQPTKSEPTKNK